MILGIGLDLCEVERMRFALAKGGFLEKYFTETEQTYILGKKAAAAESLAGHFAAKEAGLKALGCGIVFSLKDIEIAHNALGAPEYRLHGKASERLAECGGRRLLLSITHTKETAAAVAILEG